MALSQTYQRSGSFVPTTNVWDVAQIQDVDVNSPAFKELLVRLYQNVNNIANVLNTKEGGYYVQQPFVTGALWFPNSATITVTPNYRQEQRVVIDFGALPAAGTKSVPHNLSVGAKWTFTRISGCSTNPSLFTTPPTAFGAVPLGMNYIPLPYVSVRDATGSLEVSVDQVNINITTGGTDYSAWTITYIILNYLTT